MKRSESKRVGALVWPPCTDPTSIRYGQHLWSQWGDDPRFKRCMRCGTITAENISDEAKYPQERQPERPTKHRHQFVVSLLDPRYLVCRCGKALPAEPPAEPAKIDLPLTRVVHVRRDVFGVYIGRAMPRFPELHAIGWCNPFKPAPGVDAIAAYRNWLLKTPAMLERLSELRGKALGCWCAPKGGLPGNLHGTVCHGEVLAWLADHPEYAQAQQANQAQVGGAA